MEPEEQFTEGGTTQERKIKPVPGEISPLGNYTHRLCKGQRIARDRPQTQIACMQTAIMWDLPFVQNGDHKRSSRQAPFKHSEGNSRNS